MGKGALSHPFPIIRWLMRRFASQHRPAMGVLATRCAWRMMPSAFRTLSFLLSPCLFQHYYGLGLGLCVILVPFWHENHLLSVGTAIALLIVKRVCTRHTTKVGGQEGKLGYFMLLKPAFIVKSQNGGHGSPGLMEI